MIKKIAQGIYEVENFLTEDELCALLLSASEEGFVEYNIGNNVKDLIGDSVKVASSISDKIISYFENAQSQTPIKNIRRLKKGEYMDIHIDGGYPNVKKKIVFGIAIYLNDNFDGGELNYPDLNISIKPKACNMVIHESHIAHKVLTVNSGVRYSLTAFIFGDDNTKIKDSLII